MMGFGGDTGAADSGEGSGPAVSVDAKRREHGRAVDQDTKMGKGEEGTGQLGRRRVLTGPCSMLARPLCVYSEQPLQQAHTASASASDLAAEASQLCGRLGGVSGGPDFW